jgi:uncharacterized protein (TIGR03435 family)
MIDRFPSNHVRFNLVLNYFQLVGAPDWIKEDPFDIEAKAPPGYPITSASLDAATSPLRPMLRSMLASDSSLSLMSNSVRDFRASQAHPSLRE